MKVGIIHFSGKLCTEINSGINFDSSILQQKIDAPKIKEKDHKNAQYVSNIRFHAVFKRNRSFSWSI